MKWIRSLYFIVVTMAMCFICRTSSAESTSIPLDMAANQMQQALNAAKAAVQVNYSIELFQYPGYQEEVFKNNQDIVDKLKTEISVEKINRAYIKAILNKEDYSYHRIITRVKDQSAIVTANDRVVGLGTKTRQMQNQVGMSITDLVQRYPVKTTLNQVENIKAFQLSPNDNPWGMVTQRLIAAMGCASIEECKSVFLGSADGISPILTSDEDIVVKISKTKTTYLITLDPKKSYLPIKIEGLRSDKPIRWMTLIEYAERKLPGGNSLFFPVLISEKKEIRIEDKYKTYISRTIRVQDIEFLDDSIATKNISVENPIEFTKKELELLTGVNK